MNFSDIVQGEDGFLVELRCNNTFQVQLFGKIKAYPGIAGEWFPGSWH